MLIQAMRNVVGGEDERKSFMYSTLTKLGKILEQSYLFEEIKKS